MADVAHKEAQGKKERKPRSKPEGVLVKFLLPEAQYAKLKAEAEKDFRTPDNLAFLATMHHVNGAQH